MRRRVRKSSSCQPLDHNTASLAAFGNNNGAGSAAGSHHLGTKQAESGAHAQQVFVQVGGGEQVSQQHAGGGMQ